MRKNSSLRRYTLDELGILSLTLEQNIREYRIRIDDDSELIVVLDPDHHEGFRADMKRYHRAEEARSE